MAPANGTIGRQGAALGWRRFAALAALVTAAGCAATPPTSPFAGPGAAIIDAERAGFFFAEACILTAPGFENVGTVLADHPFTQNEVTGTYFHDAGNLSIKGGLSGCSLVFGTDQPSDDVVAGLARGTAAVMQGQAVPEGIDVSSRMGPDGLRYFRIGMM
ncbi:MAG: hypothetical protein AAF092_09930 [Pseudomonadota bacterium]